MHRDILRQLAADHIRDLITEAGEARRAREARHTQRRRLAAHLRRSTGWQRSSPGPAGDPDPGHAGRGRPGRGVPVVLTKNPTVQHIREGTHRP